MGRSGGIPGARWPQESSKSQNGSKTRTLLYRLTINDEIVMMLFDILARRIVKQKKTSEGSIRMALLWARLAAVFKNDISLLQAQLPY